MRKSLLVAVVFLACAGTPAFVHAWNLQGACDGVPSAVQVGEEVLWTATQTSTMKPSEGHYEWTWSGTNGLTGAMQLVPKTYTIAGIKTASVIIKLVLNGGGIETITRSCTVAVQEPPKECKLEINKLVDKTTASIGDTLTYTINMENTGTGDCTGSGVKVKDVVDPRLDFLSESHSPNISAGYETLPLYHSPTRTLYWNGDDLNPGESGSITWRGEVTAPASCGPFTVLNKVSASSHEYDDFNIWVESNTVTTLVSNECVPSIFTATCVASPASANTNEPITYTAIPTGGTGVYEYDWTGTDGLTGGATSTLKAYSTTGTKEASVIITSGLASTTATCQATITGTPPGGDPLSAVCSVNPSTLYVGGSAQWIATASGGAGSYTYEWSGSDGLSGNTIAVTHAYASIGSKSGQVSVVSGSQSITANCSLTVIPPPGGCTSGCGGGGFNPPTVVLLSAPLVGSPPPGQVLGAVYLSQIPYTGLGDWYKIVLFVIILLLWSVAVVYFFRAKVWRTRNKDALAAAGVSFYARAAKNDAVPVATQTHPAQETTKTRRDEPLGVISGFNNFSMQNKETIQPRFVAPRRADGVPTSSAPHAFNGILDIIAAEAERNRMVISEEGMKLLAERGGFDAAKVLSLVDVVVSFAEKNYDREDGWLLLNKEKILGALSGTPPKGNVAVEISRPVPAAQSIPTSRPTEQVPLKANAPTVGSSLFVNWIATGNRQEVTRHLKELREHPGGAEPFLKKVVLDLDAVYRSRFDEPDEQIDQRLAHTVSGLSNVELENLISALLSTVDQNYRSSSVSAKIALMRASQIGKGRS